MISIKLCSCVSFCKHKPVLALNLLVKYSFGILIYLDDDFHCIIVIIIIIIRMSCRRKASRDSEGDFCSIIQALEQPSAGPTGTSEQRLNRKFNA